MKQRLYVQLAAYKVHQSVFGDDRWQIRFVKRRRLALMAFPSLATLKRIQTDLFECSTSFSFVWEVKRENENDKGGGVRKIVFSFDFGSAFVRLYTLLFETQTKKLLATQSIHTIGIIWL